MKWEVNKSNGRDVGMFDVDGNDSDEREQSIKQGMERTVVLPLS